MLKDVHRQKHDISTAKFKEYFESLNITIDEFIADNEVKLLLDKYARDELSVMFSELDVSITQDEVKYAINQLHNGKSPGNDLIYEFLIAGKDILTPYITMLFDKILQSGYYPTSWTEGIIVPIHKSGDINDSENYRGITLLSIFGKLFEMYCKKWNLTVNTNKTKVMIFQKRGRISQQYKWYNNGVELEVSKAYSYLGIVFTSNGNFTKAQTKLAEQASKAMFSLFKCISKFSNLSVAILLELFDKLILPILCYSCEVWGFNKAKDIERVHLKFCKYILKMKTSTLNEIVYGEVGRYPRFIENELGKENL